MYVVIDTTVVLLDHVGILVFICYAHRVSTKIRSRKIFTMQALLIWKSVLHALFLQHNAFRRSKYFVQVPIVAGHILTWRLKFKTKQCRVQPLAHIVVLFK